MKSILIIIMLVLSSYSCKDKQVIEQNDEEIILRIKHRIYFGECLGYCNTQLIFDTTNVKFIQIGWNEKSNLPEKDTVFTIKKTQWEDLKNSVSIESYFQLDSAYLEAYYVDDGLVTIEIITNKRYKMVRHDFSKSIPILDSFNNILKNIRVNL